MKNKVISSIILLLICLSIIFFNCQIIAEENPQSYILEYAEEFVKGYDLEVAAIIPIYDLYNNIIRYCVTYNKDSKEFGYIILDSIISKGKAQLIEFAFNCNSIIKPNRKNVLINIMEYGQQRGEFIEVGNRAFYLSMLKKYLANDSANSIYDGYLDIDINLNDILNGQLQLVPYAFTFRPFIQEDLATTSQIDDGICGATTAMNVLKYYYDSGEEKYDDLFYQNADYSINVNQTYNILRSYQSSSNPYNIEDQDKRKTALNNYIKNKTTLNVTIVKYLFTTWTFFYNDIKNGKLVDVRYSYMDAGHAVLAIGAAVVKPDIYPFGTKFLCVADTWNYNVRWLNYDYHDNVKGMSINVY
ncbi:MAG: hypothetical protein ACI4MV_05795 [Christensenellales bacterium]